MEGVPPQVTARSSKRVTFAADTNFEAGGRAYKAYFRSKSNPHYKPGLHSALKRQHFHDTSFMKDPYFSCNQLKVFIGTQEEVNALYATYQAPTRDEGILVMHPLRKAITKLLDSFYENDAKRFAKDIKGSDWLLVTVEADELLEARMYQTSDVEEEDIADDLVDSFNSSDDEGNIGTLNTATKRSAEDANKLEPQKRIRLVKDNEEVQSTIDNDETSNTGLPAGS
jgi:hypothetical protein